MQKDIVKSFVFEDEILEISFICAIGHNIEVLLDSDDDFVWAEVNNISHFLDDLRLHGTPKKHGIYKWSGTVNISPAYYDNDDFEPVFSGKYTLLYSWSDKTTERD